MTSHPTRRRIVRDAAILAAATLFYYGAGVALTPHHARADTIASTKPAAAAAAEELCTAHQVHHAQYDGTNYLTDDGVWNPADHQCILIRAGVRPGFTVTSSNPHWGPGWRVQGYPFIIDGCFYGLCSYRSQFPVKVSGMSSLKVTWDTADDARGWWNVALDTYLTPGRAFLNSAGKNSAKAEVMWWLKASGPHCAIEAGQVCRKVTIAGITWYLNYWDQAATPTAVARLYVQFRSVVPRTSLTRYDLLAGYRWLASHGLISRSWYCQGVQAGFEIWRGGVGLSIHWFRVFEATS